MQARSDLKLSMGVNRNLQMELERTRTVLSDKERETLGLPALKKDAKDAKGANGKDKTPVPVTAVSTLSERSVTAPDTPAPVATQKNPAPQMLSPATPAPSVTQEKPVVKAPASVPLQQKREAATEALKPQIGHVKVSEKIAQVVKPTPKRLR